MAKNQQNFLVDPPTASSSDDDEVQISAEEEEEEDSSSDEEPRKSPVKIPSTAVTRASSEKSTVVSAGKQCSDSDSGSDTETDSEPEATNPPKSGSGKAVSASRPSKKDSTLSVAKSGTKRPASEGPALKGNDLTKRAKAVTSGEEESIKKPAFQRLWTEEDEVSVLQGMIDYADSGKSPFEDKNGFYEFLKKSISFEVSKNQFTEKIRSLRKKFMGKKCENGAEPKFSNAHDQKTYNLSKHIWGPDGIALESSIKSVGVSKKSQTKKELDSVKEDLVFVASANGKKVEDNDKDWFENSFLVRSIAGFGIDEGFVKEKWSLVPVKEKKKIEEKLKQLQANEFEFVLEKTGFVHQVTSMIAEASKNHP